MTIVDDNTARIPVPTPRDLGRSVVGYHATDVDTAMTILTTKRFEPSTNPYDWLGHGVYFWEENERRAWDWARATSQDRGALLEVRIRLGVCLDLCDSQYVALLTPAYEHLKRRLEAEGKPLPENGEQRRDLDCAVANTCAEIAVPPVETVRRAFQEGREPYPGTKLTVQDHVQVCVRNATNIVWPAKMIYVR